MRGAALILVLVAAAPLGAQQVVDRLVARVDGDVITLSELRELAGFQQLVEGRAQDQRQLLERLVEQWIVTSEAEAAQFAPPGEAAVAGEVERLAEQFPAREAWRARLRELGLGEAAVQRLVGQQLHLAAYLDYKFRPAAAIEAEQIEAYYRDELLPRLASAGRPAPPLDDVREQIRELLVQREISSRAEGWLAEARARVRVEILEGSLDR